jgi:hypothetical protein
MAEAAANFGKALESLASLPNGSQRRSSELALRLELAGTLTAVKTNLFDVRRIAQDQWDQNARVKSSKPKFKQTSSVSSTGP